MENKICVSAITPTGTMTLGNYIGAIKNLVKLQNKCKKMFIFVADLHALNSQIDPQDLRTNKKNIVALYLSCGIDPNKVSIFYQSDVENHYKLSQILENFTTIGELSRMTQYKDKSQKFVEANGTEKIVTSLLTYPVLMASDILLYQCDLVPVGQDQKQHIELARNIAQRFNNKYGKTFVLPEIYSSNIGNKIMSLNNPNIKMSKSDSNSKSFIGILDCIEITRDKILKAVTDSENKVYLSDNKPGIKNLLNIYAEMKDIDLKTAEQKVNKMNYKEFKTAVADVVCKQIAIIQNKYHNYLKIVDEIILKGKEEAIIQSNKTILQVLKKIGLN